MGSTQPTSSTIMHITIDDIRNFKIRPNLFLLEYESSPQVFLTLGDVDYNNRYNVGLRVFTVITFLIIWVLLLVIITRLIRSRDLGDRFQFLCGQEHMEIETARYHIYRAYYDGKLKSYFTGINTLLVIVIMLVMFRLPIEFFTIMSKIPVIAKNVSSQKSGVTDKYDFVESKKYWIAFKAVYVFLYAAVLAFLITYLWLYNKNNYIKSQITELNATYWTAFGAFVMANALAAFFLYYRCGIRATGFIGIIITVTLLFIITYTYNISVVNFTTNVIDKYESVTNNLTKAIKDQIPDTVQSSQPNEMKDYLIRNIQRSNPSFNPDTLQNAKAVKSYKDLFAYMMHRNGKEAITYDSANNRINLDVMKTKLDRFMYEDLTNFNSDLMKRLQTRTYSLPTNRFFYTSPINKAIRTFLIEAIYQKASTQTGNLTLDNTNIVNVINNYRGFEQSTCFNYTGTNYSSTNIKKSITGNFLNTQKYKIYSKDVDPEETSVEEILNNLVKKPFESSASLKIICDNEQKEDLLSCMAWMSTDNNLIGIDYNKVISHLRSKQSSYAYNSSMYNVIETVIALINELVKETNPLNISDKMMELRSLDDGMRTHTNNLISQVFWMSFCLIALFMFIVFHYLYLKYGDTFRIIISGLLILAITIVTVYSWAMGNMK